MSRSSDLSLFRRTATVLAAAVTGLVASSFGLTAASAATTSTPPSGYAVSINQGNVPTTASGYGSHSCDEFSGKAATADGWLFVASPDDFTSFEADFEQGTVYYNDPNGHANSAGVTFPKVNDHLAVVTPAGWTLKNAYANLSPAGDKGFFTLSHTCPATDTSTPPPTTTAPAPTAALEHSCDLGGIRVTLGNVAGTAPADFTVHYGGVDHANQVAAGATTTFTVPVAEDTTETVTVTANGMTTQTDTWARNCSVTVPAEQHAINPAVTFVIGCTTGITATLSNMQVDDTTTDAVTFVITTPSGAVEQVVVGANQITKRSYDFADGTTGTVGVQAPGLAKQTKSYAKSCTAVLGEKVTKGGTKVTKVTKVTKGSKTPPTAVEGAKATRLPMTGAATGVWLRAALLLLLAGSALSLAGRRPYRPRHAR